jgi:hypothetical protein
MLAGIIVPFRIKPNNSSLPHFEAILHNHIYKN